MRSTMVEGKAAWSSIQAARPARRSASGVDDAGEDGAVAGDVVAADERDRAAVRLPAQVEGAGEEAGQAARRLRVGEVVADVGVVGVEGAGGGTVAVALLGDGDGGDLDGGVGQDREGGVGGGLGVDGGEEAADDAGVARVARAEDAGVEAGLAAEGFGEDGAGGG